MLSQGTNTSTITDSIFQGPLGIELQKFEGSMFNLPLDSHIVYEFQPTLGIVTRLICQYPTYGICLLSTCIQLIPAKG